MIRVHFAFSFIYFDFKMGYSYKKTKLKDTKKTKLSTLIKVKIYKIRNEFVNFEEWEI